MADESIQSLLHSLRGAPRSLGQVMDRIRCFESGSEVSRSARELYRTGQPAAKGGEIARSLGVLAHYTDRRALAAIQASGYLGKAGEGGAEGSGVFLTPTPLDPWVAVTELGLKQPCDVCLLVDVRGVESIWGPGVSRASASFPSAWPGGGVEFYTPRPIPYRYVVQIVDCGDGRHHRLRD